MDPQPSAKDKDNAKVFSALEAMKCNDPADYEDSDPDMDIEIRHKETWHPGVLERWREHRDRWIGFVRSDTNDNPHGAWVDQRELRSLDNGPNSVTSFPETQAWTDKHPEQVPVATRPATKKRKTRAKGATSQT